MKLSNLFSLKLLLVLSIIFFLPGCSDNQDKINLNTVGDSIIQHLVAGEYDQVTQEYFSNTLIQSMPSEILKQEWENHTTSMGKFHQIISHSYIGQNTPNPVLETELEYSERIFSIRMIFDESNNLISFHLTNGFVNLPLPSNVIEEEIILSQGSTYELNGRLTLPKNASTPVPAVVLVHGSGPQDMDQTVYGYKIFRDIAYSLAEQGVAVIRYDKRTLRYSLDPHLISVMEETIEDAIKAGELLMNDSRIDASNIYLIGHSFGGMLAPRIIDESEGKFTGFVSLAGSPRKLWEIIYDQNLAQLENEELDSETRKDYETLLEKELLKVKEINLSPKEEAIEEFVFGLPVNYLQEMESFDMERKLEDTTLPILILQGEDDFQVYMDKDFAKWQKLLSNKDNATIKSYPHLNHFFIHYEGPDRGTITEYGHPKIIENEVIEDIKKWIISNAETNM